MTTQTSKPHSTYFHYISDPKGFIEPAQKHGASRRCQLNIAKNMQFGDRVVLLKWRGDGIPPAAFAEMIINGVSFDGNLNVGKELVVQGKAEYEDFTDDGAGDGLSVSRECGEFVLAGGYTLSEDVTMADIIAAAEKKMQEQGGNPKDVKLMVWGKVVKVYDVPMSVTLPEGQLKFNRSFAHVPEGARIGEAPAITEPIENKVMVVNDYHKYE
jgi:hypothetical protein